MKKEISKNYSFSIMEITKDKISNFVNNMKPYFDNTKFTGKLINNHSIEFDSLNELLEYNNYNKDRLKELTIRMRKDYNDLLYLNIECNGSFSYRLELCCNLESEDKIIKELEYFINSSIVINKYVFLTVKLGVYIFFIYTLLNYMEKYSVIDKIINKDSIEIFIILLGLIYFVMNKLEKYFFPKVTFLWGDEIKRIEKIKNCRIGIIFPVIIGYFFSK